MSRRKDRRCEDCGTSIAGRGGRAIRCEPCQDVVDRERDHDRHAASSERRSTILRLRRQDLSEPDPAEYQDPGEVVDYSRGDPLPGMRPVAHYRSSPRHDHARRVQEDHARQMADAEPDQLDWSQLQDARANDRRAAFPPGAGSPALDGGFRGRGEAPEITDWATAGQLYRPSPAAGQRLASAQAHDRWGGRVQPAPPVAQGQLHSAVPYVQERERAVVVQEKAASDFMRQQAGYGSWRR